MANPFELLPVELLYPEKRRTEPIVTTTTTTTTTTNAPPPLQQPQKSISSSNNETRVPRPLSEAPVRPLSEQSGLALLECAKRNCKGQVVFGKPVSPSQQQQQQQQQKQKTLQGKKHHHDTFYTPARETREERVAPSEEFDAKGKLAQAVGIIVSPVNIRYINLDFLRRHRVTMRQILTEARINIDELCHAHILCTLDDLMALDFRLDDLVVARDTLFNADKLVTHFGVTYDTLRARRGFRITVVDLLRCQFHPNELRTLEFSFDYMIENKFVTKKELAAFKFDLEGMRLCGFRPEHVDALRISNDDVARRFKWDTTEYAAFCDSGASSSSSSSGVITGDSSSSGEDRPPQPRFSAQKRDKK